MKNKTYIVVRENPYDDQGFVVCDDCLKKILPIKNRVLTQKADSECSCDYCGKV